MNILLKYHIRKEDEKYSLDEKCWTIYPPQNCQVRFTLKSPSLIYPQIVCTIYPPPPKLPSLIYPQIVFGNLPPPKSPSPIYPKIAKSDLPSNRLYDLPPPHCQVWFTLKSSLAIYLPPEIANLIWG